MTIRRNKETIIASAARTATNSSNLFVASDVISSEIIISVTSITTTPSVVFTVEGQDPISGSYWTILTSAAVTATGLTVLHVGTGIASIANLSSDKPLPAKYRVTATHADADSITYSVGVTHVTDNRNN